MTYFKNKINNDGSSLTTWEVSMVSATVYQILDKNTKGTVHSVFNNSFNLIFGERIIHIGSVENGIAPFGIGMNHSKAKQLTMQIKREQSAVWDAVNQQVLIGNKHYLKLNKGVQTNHSLPSQRFNPSIVKNNIDYITSNISHEKWQTGLAQSANEKDLIIHSILSQNASRSSNPMITKFNDLKTIALERNTKQAQTIFDYWIGRGLGLTPSGDDLITGMCASLSVLHGTSNHLHQQMGDYIMRYGLHRTTQIGYEYLYYAAKHEYHSHLIQFCKTLLKRRDASLPVALEEMRAIGHTSGTDTIIGVLLGMKVGTAKN